MDLTPNAVIAGRYRVETKVGAGGMGEVWLGEHIAVGARVAIKTLLPAAAMNHEVIARFRREAYLLGRIRSENVARVVDFVTDDVYGLVLVMEFCEGDALSRLLQERTLTIEEGVDLAIGLARALKDLHGASIIHRDLKPGNIIMTPLPDGRRRAVVVDFGVSRLMSDKGADEDEELTGITRADMAVGTIEYMAPEQILNSRNVTPGSDIYAAGAMLFRSTAGRHIHGNLGSDTELAQKKLTTESPPLPLQRTDAIAEGFARVVARMVKRRPSERYKTADEVLADLLPLSASARATGELESTTVDSKGLATGGLATAALVAAVAAPVAAAPAAAPVAPPMAPAPAAAIPAPVAGDSSVSVASPSGGQPRRGVHPVVTLGLVAAALVGGVLLGPRVLQPLAAPVAAVPSSESPRAAAPPPASPPAATEAPVLLGATATAEAVPPTVPAGTVAQAASTSAAVAVVAPGTNPAAPDAGAAPTKAAPPVRVPGPMPRPAPQPGDINPL